MLIASGTLLVLITWALALLALVSLGLVPALLSARAEGGGRCVGACSIRHAAWWGLLIVTVFAYAINLWLPLYAGGTAVAGIALVVVLGVPGWLMWRQRRSSRPINERGTRGPAPSPWTWVALWVALGASLVYLAAAAVGPVTNYDSGLYHLGAIAYAGQFATIPGLANLSFPFGYGNAEFPLAALFGNGPWSGEGYRLLNGFVMAMAVTDLALRARQRRWTPGFLVLAVGVLAAWVPMVALSDYWVTSPTQDSSVFIVTIVASAYVTDMVRGRGDWIASAATTIVLSTLLVLLRPTMVAFAATALVVTIVLVRRRRGQVHPRQARTAAALVAVLAVLAAALATARDVVLSGWLQYPLSVLPFDVPWRAADPTQYRDATLGYHRDPANLWESVEGWSWVGPWLSARLTQWETYEFLGLLCVTVVLLALASRCRSRRLPVAAIGMAMFPSLVATIVWWAFTPPSYRFAWGSLFTLATVPIGWAVWVLAANGRDRAGAARRWQSVTALAVAVPVLLVTGYSALARYDAAAVTEQRTWSLLVSIPYAVAPITAVPVQTVRTSSGLELLQPTLSDQCWANWPLCTPSPNTDLHLRGAVIADGFLP